jgi:hypothetical protein
VIWLIAYLVVAGIVFFRTEEEGTIRFAIAFLWPLFAVFLGLMWLLHITGFRIR